jgi:hypothetical protein
MKNKYSIGQVVFFKVDGVIRCSAVQIITKSLVECAYHVAGASNFWTPESRLYPDYESVPQ